MRNQTVSSREKLIDKERLLHYIMCLEGGLLAAYAIALRGQLGSAQTGNLLQMLLAAAITV